MAAWSPERIADTNAVSEGPTLASTLGKRSSSFLEYDYGGPLDCATSRSEVTSRSSSRASSPSRGHQDGGDPLMDGALASAVEAMCCRKMGSAIRTNGLALEGVECVLAPSALPELADGRPLFAMRTGILVAPRQLFHAG